MLWNATIPEDTDNMNAIHTFIQNDKVMIRERMECTNDLGTAEHHESDSADFGTHKPSKIGFVKVHDTYSNLTGFTPLVPGSLHYVREAAYKGLYIIDSDDSIVKIGADDHGQLESLLDNNAHSIYLLKTGAREMEGDLTVGSGTLSYTSLLTDNDNPLDPDHVSDSWYDAHGAGGITGRHIVEGSILQSGALTSGLYVQTDLNSGFPGASVQYETLDDHFYFFMIGYTELHNQSPATTIQDTWFTYSEADGTRAYTEGDEHAGTMEFNYPNFTREPL
jgi:hypothetical protein